MEFRRLGKTNLQVSVVGFGTCQLRMVPRTQAIETLLRGFELGVNLIHTAPDYEGAEDLVAEAVAQTDQKVIVASQGYDVHYNSDSPVRHFESLFEATCTRLKTERLDLFGIACMDDREAYQENVWGKGGMVEFLLKKKEEGRLGGIFCTTHGNPAYIKQLIKREVFDAIMIAYNVLGYHLLSYNPPAGRHFESLPRNQLELFPLCQEHDVGVMVMKPFAGGLLCKSKAFPPRHQWETPLQDNQLPQVSASNILRSILLNSEVACVLPGTASVAEAEDNAHAGWGAIEVNAESMQQLQNHVSSLQTSLCSRCGACESSCSQQLPISWLYRAAYISLHPSETFETWAEVEYFRLHPALAATCSTCPNVTCTCPYGIDIPKSLTRLHSEMIHLRDQGLINDPREELERTHEDDPFAARIVIRDIPSEMISGQTYISRLYVENIGTKSWFPESKARKAGVSLAVFVDDRRVNSVALRQEVYPKSRCHFIFEIAATAPLLNLSLVLIRKKNKFNEFKQIELFSGTIPVQECTQVIEKQAAISRWRRNIEDVTHWVQKELHSKLFASKMTQMAPQIQPPYGVDWLFHNLPQSWTPGGLYQIYLCVKNSGSRSWVAQHPQNQHVCLTVSVHDKLVLQPRLPHDVAPGNRVTLSFPIRFPEDGESGEWELKFSLIEKQVARFEKKGVEPLVIKVSRTPIDESLTAQASAIARQSNSAFYLPSQGVIRSRNGSAYPLFVQQAKGCRIWDLEGHEWIDYVMGWGSCLLGYAHPDIQAAIATQLGSGAVLSLPHVLEIQLTQMLCDLIPSAERVLFGKNGSDVCTAAIRIARLSTQRQKILVSGYSGWHDWNLQDLAPELIAPDQPKDIHRFSLNNLAQFCQLIKQYSGEIAAVILEPAAQVEGVDGPVRDADPTFLKHVAEICREQSVILIFDEIMTGFRYAQGSVQKATGITPDLACFGKALTSGMPLSVLVGRRQIIDPVLPRIFYHPTFKGEAYSFAAAIAALQIYQSQDIPKQIWEFGTRLKQSINLVSQELEIAGQMVGLPYRMVYKFLERKDTERILMRTLLQQELLQRGILTFRGFMLPSAAHGDEELEKTVDAYRSALQHVQKVSKEKSFAHHLEIPPII